MGWSRSSPFVFSDARAVDRDIPEADTFAIQFLPLLDYFLFGRWVSAEAAALFAALLLLGSRKTLDAALAAFLLVTSRFGLRLGIGFLTNFATATIGEHGLWELYLYRYHKYVYIVVILIIVLWQMPLGKALRL